jgi:hypothetical protein
MPRSSFLSWILFLVQEDPHPDPHGREIAFLGTVLPVLLSQTGSIFLWQYEYWTRSDCRAWNQNTMDNMVLFAKLTTNSENPIGTTSFTSSGLES